MSEERIRASIIDNKVSISISVSMVLDCGEYFCARINFRASFVSVPYARPYARPPKDIP